MAQQGSSYAGIPPGPLSAYLGVRETNRAGGLQDLQEVGAVQGLLARIRDEQEINQLKGVMQQAGGDPQKAVQALLASGTPKAIALAAQLKGLMPKPAEPFTLAPGAQRFSPEGKVVAAAPVKPEPFSLVPGGRRFDESGRVIASVPANPIQSPAPIIKTIKHPASSTGWAHIDIRTGTITPEAPPPGAGGSPFESELQRQTAKDYTKIVEDSQRMGDQLDLTKKAISQFRDYTQGQLLGTGPLATLAGTTKYVSSKTEALEAVFRTINLKNMVATFSGMTRAIDTDAERRAWEATQPGVSLDDPTNAQILVGGLSLAAKTQAEGAARKQFIETSPDKTLKGYVSPVIGKTSVLFTQNGDPVVILKDQIDKGKAQGLMTDWEYEQQVLGKGRRRTDKPQQGWSMRPVP